MKFDSLSISLPITNLMCFPDANDDNKKHNEAVKEIIMQYDKEVAERDEEIEALKLKLAGENPMPSVFSVPCLA